MYLITAKKNKTDPSHVHIHTHTHTHSIINENPIIRQILVQCRTEVR